VRTRRQDVLRGELGAGLRTDSLPPDQSSNQPASVDHFVCYRAAAKSCLDADCSRLRRFDRKAFALSVHDQFSIDTVDLGEPQLLCVPAAADVINPSVTTTTSTSSTTTTFFTCAGMAVGLECNGTCPPGLACVASAGIATCECVPPEDTCAGGTVCSGLCPRRDQQCVPSAGGSCECVTECGFSAPACNGHCSNPQLPVCVADAAGNCVCSNGTCLNRGSACTEPAQCCSNLCQLNGVCA
jgi:hypothetical protein